jgi:hypothetical protein
LPLRTVCAALHFKLVSRILQTMVNVDGPDLPWPLLHTGQQQGGGIGAAAEGDGQREFGLKAGRDQARTGKR